MLTAWCWRDHVKGDVNESFVLGQVRATGAEVFAEGVEVIQFARESILSLIQKWWVLKGHVG